MKKKILYLFIILTSIFMMNRVSATEISQSGDNVVHEGEYSSLRLVAGNKVDNKAKNDGLSVMAAQDLVLEGISSYGFYAGKNVTFNETIEKDLFLAGLDITFESDSVINRDAYIAGNSVKLNTTIKRDLRIGASTVDLSNAKIGEDAYIDAEKIIVNENTVIEGTLDYPENITIVDLEKAKISNVKMHAVEVEKEVSIYDKLSSSIISFIAKYILLILILIIIPAVKEKLENTNLEASSIFKNIGIGFTLLIMVPILAIFGMITVVLLPVGLISLVLYVIAIYLAYIFVSYVVGNLISTKLFNRENIYLSAFIGLLVCKFVSLIPGIGGLVIFLSLLFGIGNYINLLKKN